MDLVLSFPKLIDSLLSMNHWCSDKNSLCKAFSTVFNAFLLVENTNFICIQNTNRSQLLIMIGKDNLHITEKGAVQELNLVVHHTLTFQPQKKIINTNQNFFA